MFDYIFLASSTYDLAENSDNICIRSEDAEKKISGNVNILKANLIFTNITRV